MRYCQSHNSIFSVFTWLVMLSLMNWQHIITEPPKTYHYHFSIWCSAVCHLAIVLLLERIRLHGTNHHILCPFINSFLFHRILLYRSYVVSKKKTILKPCGTFSVHFLSSVVKMSGLKESIFNCNWFIQYLFKKVLWVSFSGYMNVTMYVISAAYMYFYFHQIIFICRSHQ